ncbi:MAG: tyrosine-type recombinase/integrase, partial [Flavobacteriaceae bacterium]|nr:tyrosine-type recombinase/integrase [Flavobacteriaceae bacterium]
GCRRAEIARLQWQDVQGDTCRIIGKGDKERVIPLLPKAQEAMGAKKDIGHVFIHWVDLNKYSKKFKVIARACNIKKRHLHNLRHTAGTAMLESGIPIEIVQEMLGHSDLSTTRIYARIRQEKLKKEMKKLSYDLS